MNVARLIARSRMEHFVVTQRDDDANWGRLAELAIEIHHLSIRTIRPSTLWRLVILARRGRIDVLHSHGRGAGLYARLAALVLGIPLVHTYRGFHNRFNGVEKYLFNLYEWSSSFLIDRAVAVSPSERDKILAAGAMPARKLEVVYNPIELSTARAAREAAVCSGRFNVVSLSRISPQKDLLTLVEVARHLGPGFAIHVFGGVNSSDGEYEAAVKAHLARTGVDNLLLHGDLPGAASMLSRYDAYVSTSLWEGLPTAIVEAFLAGVPVVATDCTGNCDVVRDGITGLLCAPGDAAAIANGLRRLAGDPKLRQDLCQEAARFMRAEFDPERLVARMDEIYCEVVNA